MPKKTIEQTPSVDRNEEKHFKVPVTSLDDDVYSSPIDNHVQQQDEQQKIHPVPEFMDDVMESHLVAQRVFDMAQLEREILQSHLDSEKVFHQLRIDKENETIEMRKQMEEFHQQAVELHRNLEQLFVAGMENQITEEVKNDEPELIKPKAVPKPTGPLSAVFQELKSKTSVIDDGPLPATDEKDSIELLTIPVTPKTPERGRKDSNGSSQLMLEELKKAIHSFNLTSNETTPLPAE